MGTFFDPIIRPPIKGSFVTAEAADGAAAAAAEISQEPKMDADEDGMGGAEGEEEPTIPGATVQVLTDGDFERITQASTGATTGDWFVGERERSGSKAKLEFELLVRDHGLMGWVFVCLAACRASFCCAE